MFALPVVETNWALLLKYLSIQVVQYSNKFTLFCVVANLLCYKQNSVFSYRRNSFQTLIKLLEHTKLYIQPF